MPDDIDEKFIGMNAGIVDHLVGAAELDLGEPRVFAYKSKRTASRGIMMTGNPQRTHEHCHGYGHETGCDGVMIDVTFDNFIIPLCRRHLDLLGDMIAHTRQLREAGSAD